jgi:ABC-type dipeptide/oligopeptide/nickel transport system permease subunit
VLFTGSLLIETIFSLDGLGLLGFEAAINRDYPVVFANALFLHADRPGRGLISDLTYTWIDPRIDFEARGSGSATRWRRARRSRRAALALTRAGCASSAPTGAATGRSGAAVGRNWLGTDDQGRDVVARLIYGFRISVLFG